MDKEIEIDLKRWIKAIIKKSWLWIITGLLCYGIGFVVFRDVKTIPTYSASSSVYSVANGSYKESIEATNAMKDYAEIISSYKVCERAALLLGDDSIDGQYIMGSISPFYSNTSSIITIQAYSIESQVAIDIANAVANAFVLEMRSITGENNVQLLDEAYTYNLFSTGKGNTDMMRMIMGLGGIVIGMAYVVLSEMLSNKVKTVKDCTLHQELDVIGIIPTFRN